MSEATAKRLDMTSTTPLCPLDGSQECAAPGVSCDGSPPEKPDDDDDDDDVCDMQQAR